MKYFTAKLWEDGMSPNKGIREKAVAAWTENSKKYSDFVAANRELLPQELLNFIEGNKQLHDSPIKLFQWEAPGSVNSFFQIGIDCGKCRYSIEFHGISKLSICHVGEQSYPMGQLTWSYSELDILGDGLYRLNVLCDMACEIEIVFENALVKATACRVG